MLDVHNMSFEVVVSSPELEQHGTDCERARECGEQSTVLSYCAFIRCSTHAVDCASRCAVFRVAVVGCAVVIDEEDICWFVMHSHIAFIVFTAVTISTIPYCASKTTVGSSYQSPR